MIGNPICRQEPASKSRPRFEFDSNATYRYVFDFQVIKNIFISVEVKAPLLIVWTENAGYFINPDCAISINSIKLWTKISGQSCLILLQNLRTLYFLRVIENHHREETKCNLSSEILSGVPSLKLRSLLMIERNKTRSTWSD
ncbi:hypothetical protein ACHAXS_008610 [Conticribra weissflogii]